MAFNPRTQNRKKCEVIPYNKMQELKAQAEVDEQKCKLKPLPRTVSKQKTKLEYYIEIWKLGETDKFASVFKTANLKYVMSLILNAGHHVVYLMRMKDKKVIWDKR